jgi:hypothetical protein
MDKNLLLRKCLTVGIILLFIGIALIPSTMSESLLSVHEIPIIDINTVSAKVPENNGSWGFILSTEFTVTYIEATNASKSVDWWGGPLVEFTVMGIGNIRFTPIILLNLITGHSIVPMTCIYAISIKKPIIKIKVNESSIVLSYLFKKGTWAGKLYIDGTLISTIQYSYERI